MDIEIYKQFVDSLPIPTLLAKVDENGNHQTFYVSPRFVSELGYSLEDIPDKQSWWQKAYPDPGYREAVTRQWELEYQLAKDNEQELVSSNVLITNKYGHQRRYRVATNLNAPIIEGIYQVFFINLEPGG